MKNDSDHNDSMDPTADTGKEFAARRSVVKGLASAVPVVMTIGCGKAAAAVSITECYENQPLVAPEVCIDPGQGANDRWLRKNRLVTIDVDSATGNEITADSPLASYQGPTSAARTRTTETTGTATRTRSSGDSAASLSSRFEQETVKKRCLVYVNERGDVVRDAMQGKPVTPSCMLSFMPT